MSELLQYVTSNHARYVNELSELLAIPSVSALPQHNADLRRCAEWTAAQLARVGLQNVRLFETPGHPIVYGDWLQSREAPTILCYGHYDVQPSDPLQRWVSPPFEPTIRDGKLYARGASDDKGQFFAHLKAIEALLVLAHRLPVNIKMLVEGEEEVGGTHLDDFVCSQTACLRADAIVISDGAMFDRGVPSLCLGMRGLAYFQIDVHGAASDLHSGSFGGTVANPAFVLAQLMGRLKDVAERIAIPGFYERVRPLAAAERAAIADIPFDEHEYGERLGVPALAGEAGYTTLERAWLRPTLDVNGLSSGFAGEGAKTVLPAEAVAKISMRLVPDQDPDEIGDLLEAYVRDVTPTGVRVAVTRMNQAQPWAAKKDSLFLPAAQRALETAFGVRPLFTREGGSNPIVPRFEQILHAPVVMFPLGLPDDQPHAPNERLDLETFQKGIVACARLYEEIGSMRS